MAFASAGLPPPALNAAAAEGAARGRDGAQAANDGQTIGVKRRLNSERVCVCMCHSLTHNSELGGGSACRPATDMRWACSE